MKKKSKKHCLYFYLIIVTKCFSQNSDIITNNIWFFDSMTTITKAKREKITIFYKDEKNFESLTFKKPNILEYYVINDGFEHTGLAKWNLKKDNLRIISGQDTIKSILKIEDNILSIVTYDTEPKTNYGYTTIIKYNTKPKKSE